MKIAVIGGGPAGAMAAGQAAAGGADVILIEKNARIGRKLMITGKGRCNLTNACDMDELMRNIPVNGRFLYSCLNRFSNYDLIDFFEARGVPTKIERGNRVFPKSDKSMDIIDTLDRFLRENSVRRKKGVAKEILTADGAVSGVLLHSGEKVLADAVVLATGGASYPITGSTGDGYKIAADLGHTITKLSPSLVPLVCVGNICSRLAGLSLKNIGFRMVLGEDTVYSDFGEMIFTHYGISGPVVLSASAHMKGEGKHFAVIDLKPALSFETLDKRLLRDFEKYSRRDFINSLDDLLPKTLVPVICEISGIDLRKKVHEITREERHALCTLLKGFTLQIYGMRPIEEAVITSGGVAVDEINPKTMESKIVKNLYFAGEIIDVDAYTGGFNLQIAFSTGYAAGVSIQGGY